MPRFVLAFAAAALALARLAPAASAQPDLPDRPLVVMNLAAHPDDEDGLTMAYYRGNQDAVVYSVVATRGEGGQNEAGPDLYERLGAIRTAETEAAARILGTRVTYLDRYDFGFSKHAAEAFAEWSAPRTGFWDARGGLALDAAAGRDALVADVVRLVRRYKPDVLFTNHDTTTAWPDAQHGHHQAVGIAAFQAFGLAADPGYYPEQLDEPGVDLWQPSRLFLRQGGFSDGAPDAYDVAVPVGDECAATAGRPAESCADRAVAAASQHVSQGFDTFAPRFRRDTTYFALLAASASAPALPPGATDLAAGLAPNPHAADLDLATLVDSERLAPLDGLAVASETVVPSQSSYVSWTPAASGALTVEPPPGAPTQGLFAAEAQTAPLSAGRLRVPVPSGTTPTAPAYRAQYGTERGTAPMLYAVREHGQLVAGGRLPVQIVPPATVDLDAAPIRLASGTTEIPVSLTVYEAARDTVTVGLTVLDADDRAVSFQALSVAAADGGAVFTVDLKNAAPGRYRVVAEARTTGCGLPWYRVSRPAAVLPDVAVAPDLRVGFVRSYDGTMGDALAVMGAEVADLDSTALATGDFGDLDTVVIDIRATLERPDLTEHFPRLLDWVERGGHLVVGYHKSFEWNADADRYAPFPLRLGRDRVVDETAPVTVLQPESPLFTLPHPLTAADWDGWVQERGLYFPDEPDDRYQRLVSVGDPGEAPLTTGLLLAQVGRGTYVYSPLVWYRQLAALNPGAWRAFANLVSLPLVDGRAAGGRATVGTR